MPFSIRRKQIINQLDEIIKNCELARELLVWHPSSKKIYTYLENACETAIELVEHYCTEL